MNGRGRPLRFLALVFSGWIGFRVAERWPESASLPEGLKALSPLPLSAQAARSPAPLPHAREMSLPPPIARSFPLPAMVEGTDAPLLRLPEKSPLAANGVAVAERETLGPAILGASLPPPPVAKPPLLPAQPDHLPPPPDRWSASGWAVVRPGTGIGAAPGGGQLGGSQAGVRVAWKALPTQKLAVFGRLTAPLRGRGAEVAVGAEWQPARAPVRLVIERRMGLDGVAGGFGAGAVGGTDGQVAPGLRLESYGQAGAIRRARLEPYADGAARLTIGVTGEGRLRLAAGGGIWGAAQRDAQRLDIGPSLTLTVPVAEQSVRVALDWRQRVAGGARPGSGLALTLGSDF